MITRVYGRADSYEIEFTESGGMWNAAVPADLTDGKYVVELWAEDERGVAVYYTGILYMFDGNAVLELSDDDIHLGIYSDDIFISFSDEMELKLMNDLVEFDLIEIEIVGEWCER